MPVDRSLPFIRRRRACDGAGHGLSIVERIMERMGEPSRSPTHRGVVRNPPSTLWRRRHARPTAGPVRTSPRRRPDRRLAS